jgi:hypothetical protein
LGLGWIDHPDTAVVATAGVVKAATGATAPATVDPILGNMDMTEPLFSGLTPQPVPRPGVLIRLG